MTILFGVVYPLVTTGICQVVFPHQANGSLITAGGKVIGSELIGQNFTRPEYFQPRPSAAGATGTTRVQRLEPWADEPEADRPRESHGREFRNENPDYHGPIPADGDSVGSGLDPHISPDSAARSTKARGRASGQANRRVPGQLLKLNLA